MPCSFYGTRGEGITGIEVTAPRCRTLVCGNETWIRTEVFVIPVSHVFGARLFIYGCIIKFYAPCMQEPFDTQDSYDRVPIDSIAAPSSIETMTPSINALHGAEGPYDQH